MKKLVSIIGLILLVGAGCNFNQVEGQAARERIAELERQLQQQASEAQSLASSTIADLRAEISRLKSELARLKPVDSRVIFKQTNRCAVETIEFTSATPYLFSNRSLQLAGVADNTAEFKVDGMIATIELGKDIVIAGKPEIILRGVYFFVEPHEQNRPFRRVAIIQIRRRDSKVPANCLADVPAPDPNTTAITPRLASRGGASCAFSVATLRPSAEAAAAYLFAGRTIQLVKLDGAPATTLRVAVDQMAYAVGLSQNITAPGNPPLTVRGLSASPDGYGSLLIYQNDACQ